MTPSSNVLNYTGNANLGLNSEGLAEYGETDVAELNKTVYNAAFLNMQKNKNVWEQKVKDRDEAMKLIANGKLEINNALPQDREVMMKKLEEVKSIWFENGGDVKSDPNVWLKLNDKLADFTGANTIAQTRLLTYQRGIAEAAAETNPVKKKRMLDHWDNEQKNKDIYKPFDPYQQTLDYDVVKTLPGVTTTSTTSRDGDYDVTETKTDSDKSYNDYLLTYVTNDKGETAPNIDAHFDDFFGQNGLRSEESVFKDVALVNEKLKKIAIIEGFDITDPDKLPERFQPIKVGKMKDGTLGVNFRKDQAMSKVNLALKYQAGQSKVVNPNYAKIDTEKKQGRLYDSQADAAKALAAQRRSVIPLNAAKAKYWNSKISDAENEQKVYNIFDDVVARSKKMNINTSDGKSETVDMILVGDMPPGFSQVLGGVRADGLPQKLQPFTDKKGVQYFVLDKSDFLVNDAGQRFSLSEQQNAFKSQSKYPTFDKFKEFMLSKGYKADTEVRGKNGSGTSQATIEGLRALNNKNASRYDETIFQADDNENDNSGQTQ